MKNFSPTPTLLSPTLTPHTTLDLTFMEGKVVCTNHSTTMFASDCARSTGPQLISYNASQLVKDRFKEYKTGEFDLTYTMRSVGEYMREQQDRKELLLLNY